MKKVTFVINCPCKVYFHKDGFTFKDYAIRATCSTIPDDQVNVDVEFDEPVDVQPDDLKHDVLIALEEHVHPRYSLNKINIDVDLRYGFTREKRTI